MDLYVIAFFLLFIPGLKTSPKGEIFEDYMSKNYTNQLRGICALVIILRHISDAVLGGKVFFIFHGIGYLAVSVFFALSGFGLMTSYLKKGENYLDGFLKLRLFSVGIPYIIVFFIYFFVFRAYGNTKTFFEAVITIFSNAPYVSNSWYIIAIFLFYIIFFISAKIGKTRKNILIMNGAWIVLYSMICLFLNRDRCWYNATICYFLGLILATYYEKITKMLKKLWLPTLLISSFLFVITFSIGFINQSKTVVISEMISSVIFTIFVFSLSTKVKFLNPIYNWLGKISLETYLIHGLFVYIFIKNPTKINNSIVYAAVVIISTIIASIILNYLFSFMLGKYKIIIDKKKISSL